MKKTLIFISIFLCQTIITEAQIGSRILNRVHSRARQNANKKASEEISNKILNKIFSNSDSTEVDAESFSFDKTDEMPEQYNFDLRSDIKSTSGKDVSNIRLYYSNTMAVIGMENLDDSKGLIVMDFDNDLTVLYATDKKGNKTVQATPSFQKFAGKILKKKIKSNHEDFSMEKTGNTKTILGYLCDEYKGHDKKTEITWYFTKKNVMSYNKNYYTFLSQYLPKNQSKQFSDNKDLGMMLSMTSTSKRGKINTWEVTKIDKSPISIKKSDYSTSNP